jgi:glycosyl transferase family 2
MGFLAPLPSTPIEPQRPVSFSVVIPAYQAADTIGEAVASALDQTHPPHEVIVVDDGSTDDLDGALAEFRDLITLIRKDNGGGASARNVGIAAASGEFFAILDADDVYGVRRLEVLAALAAARPDLDILTTDTEFVLNGQIVGRFHTGTPFVAIGQREAILKSCFVGGWPAVRMSRLWQIGGFDETFRIAYDWDCWVRLILGGALAGFVDEPHLRYRLHPASLSANRVEALWERVRVVEKAAANTDLHPDERPALVQALRDHRTRAVLAESDAALARGEVQRMRLLRHAVSRDVMAHARLRLAAVAAAPELGKRWLPRDPGALERRLSPHSD